MSKRSIKKIRHHTTFPSFAECVKAGQNKEVVTITAPEVVSNNQPEHIHGDNCNHE